MNKYHKRHGHIFQVIEEPFTVFTGPLQSNQIKVVRERRLGPPVGDNPLDYYTELEYFKEKNPTPATRQEASEYASKWLIRGANNNSPILVMYARVSKTKIEIDLSEQISEVHLDIELPDINGTVKLSPELAIKEFERTLYSLSQYYPKEVLPKVIMLTVKPFWEDKEYVVDFRLNPFGGIYQSGGTLVKSI